MNVKYLGNKKFLATCVKIGWRVAVFAMLSSVPMYFVRQRFESDLSSIVSTFLLVTLITSIAIAAIALELYRRLEDGES